MTLCHYSVEPFAFDPSRTYAPRDHFKPAGLWLSVDGDESRDWKEWCEVEEFRLDGLAHRTEFVLTPDANVLHLASVGAIREFTQTYLDKGYAPVGDQINWTRVAELYDGIMIAPYQWACRNDLSTFWYYPWDCASGCAWNLRALEVIRVTA